MLRWLTRADWGQYRRHPWWAVAALVLGSALGIAGAEAVYHVLHPPPPVPARYGHLKPGPAVQTGRSRPRTTAPETSPVTFLPVITSAAAPSPSPSPRAGSPSPSRRPSPRRTSPAPRTSPAVTTTPARSPTASASATSPASTSAAATPP